MALDVNPFDQHVVARLFEFFGDRTPWTRRLWSVSTVLALRELLESVDAVAQGRLTDASVAWFSNRLKSLVGPDPGVGSSRQTLNELLGKREPWKSGGHDYLRLREVTDIVSSDYLNQWAKALRQSESCGDKGLAPEAVASRISGYLLDAGFSFQFLHRWWKRKCAGDTNVFVRLSNIVDDAHLLAREPQRRFCALIAFAADIRLNPPLPAGWLNATDVATWLKANGFDTSDLRQHGGVLMDVEARDPWAAVATIADRVDRLAARIAIGQGRRFDPAPAAWLKGYSEPFKLRVRRTVEVHALDRQQRVFAETDTTFVDDALELVRPLHDGAAPAAIVGAWAAVESLLSRPGDRDKVTCADRLAVLVACSYPRAELTRLSYAHMKHLPGQLSDQLMAAASNRVRCELLIDALRQDATLAFGTASDRLAIAQMRQILSTPFESLRAIQDDVIEALRRLYRVRNLIIHGARTRGTAVGASLRSAPHLVGQGLDRIAHAWIADNVEPSVLVARAHVRLDGLRGNSTALITRLLDS